MIINESSIKEVKKYKSVKKDIATAEVIMSDGKAFFLHSIVDPEEEATEWANNFALKAECIYIVLGFGLGYHVRELVKRLPEGSYIYVIESGERKTFAGSLIRYEEYSWMKTDKVTYFSEPNIYRISSIMNKFMQAKRINRAEICKHFPSMKIDEAFYQRVGQNLVSDAQKLYQIDFSFRYFTGHKLIKNAWNNLSEIIKSPGVTEFENKFKNMPAIIVSSGPSLNKNIHILKELRNKAIIIASGTAIGALKEHGINPHFTVIIDPHEINADCLLPSLEVIDTVLVAPYTAPKELISGYKGKKCFYLAASDESNPNANILEEIMRYLPESRVLAMHISVAVTAINLADVLDANPIIMVGQDLSIPDSAFEDSDSGERTHAIGVKAGKIDTTGDKNRFEMIEGYYGGQVRTLMTFKLVRDYIASYASGRKKHFINATEGGALIKCFENISLEQVAKRYLTKKINIDSIINKVMRKNRCSSERLNSEVENIIKLINAEVPIWQKLKQRALEQKFLLIDQSKCDVDRSERGKLQEDINLAIENIRGSKLYKHLAIFLDVLFNETYFEKKDCKDEGKLFVQYKKTAAETNEILAIFLDSVKIAKQNLTQGVKNDNSKRKRSKQRYR